MTTLTQNNSLQDERFLALYQASIDLVQEFSLDNLLEKLAIIAMEQTSAAFAAVGTLDENGNLEKFIPIGMTRLEIDQMEHPPSGKGLVGLLMNSPVSIRIKDIASDPRSAGFPAFHPRMKTFLGVPVRHGSRQLGQIYLTDKEGGLEFTAEDQHLIEMLAAYAAVAISNARLYRSLIQRDRVLTRRNENLALLDQLASTLSTSTDLDTILENGLNQLMDYLRLEVAEVYLRPADSRSLILKNHRGDAVENLWKQAQYNIGEGTIGRSAQSGNPVVLNITENEYADLNPLDQSRGIHQIAVLPMNGRLGVVGVLCVATSHPQPLDELEVQFLQAIASWVATAVENVYLNEQGKRLAILEERDRIGMDLHDGIIQSIYGVGLTLEHARLLINENPQLTTGRIEQAIKDLNHTIRDIRAYILDLRPRQLKDENLIQGLQRLVTEFKVNTLIDVHLKGAEEDFQDLPNPQAVALFHICQEALANIAKHAKAHRVNVVVWKTVNRALIEVKDDGRGFDLEKIKKSIGHGLSNMETRAANAGGELDITTEPGEGTSVLAWVPIPESDPLPIE
jgi:two-component system, NarL family, sensor histidine kinase DevS